MKKVLHILNELKFSGAEIMYVNAAPIFQQLGYKLYVINTTEHLGEYASHFERAGYTVLHWPYPKNMVKRWSYYRHVISFIRKEHIDVVHIHNSGMKWGMSYCAKRAHANSVYTFHNCFPIRWFSKPYQIWLRWSAKHIFGCRFQTISDSVYENELKVFHNRTTLVYNWYGNKRFYPGTEEEKLQSRTSLGIAKNALVVISVGGCSEIKRHTEIIKALPLVLQKYPDAIYLHLGHGAALEAEEQLAKDLGVFDHIRFEGNQNNVRKFLIASDLYLMTSVREGISITTIEAMACNIPAILYDVPGLRDFNKEKECSILIKEDYKTLADAICALYADKALQNERTKNASEYVNLRYSIDKNVREIAKLYE